MPVAATWQEVTSVHHEGLPGHHLQFVVTASYPDLHPWQRHLCHIHGYAEGWAHYAEQLADELGLIRDPAERLGLLLGQIWRSVRIVADIGLHTGWAVPAEPLVDETEWTPELAQRMLVDLALVEPHLAGFEVDRYLGWPGQALAFKVGARLWNEARAARAAADGDAFSLRDSTAMRWVSARWGSSRCRAQLLGRSVHRRGVRLAELGEHLAPEQRDPLGGVDAVRRAELDAIHARLDEPLRLSRRCRPACPRTRTDRAHRAARAGPRPRRRRPASRARIAGSRSSGSVDRRVQRRHDVEVHRHLATRVARARHRRPDRRP